MRRSSAVFLVVLVTAGSWALLAASPPAAAAGQVSLYMQDLNNPIALAFAPDGRIFYAEWVTGQIRIIEDGTLLETPFYTLENTVTGGERGLLGLALDPDFETMPYVYAYHTYLDVDNATIHNRIVRILADGNTGVSHTVILKMPPVTATNHHGGVIAFGPDGRLYAVVGEDAKRELSQDPSSPMGKVLRMSRDGWAPDDNPFIGNSTWFNLTYTYGHRNMFGLAFHELTDPVRILVTENGPGCNDEINLLVPGGNFGWGPSEDCSAPFPPNNTNRDGPDPILPIWWWDQTICPTNAAVYVGPGFPARQGDLFMGDCNSGRLHRLDLTEPNYDAVENDTVVWTSPDLIFDVELGPDGAIWVTTLSAIYRFWDSGTPPVASFTASPNPVVVGSPVTFNASMSRDPDGTIVSHAWDFDDGTNGTGETVTHVFAGLGTYNVTLTVVDNESFAATAYQEIDVAPSTPEPRPPVARFTVSPSPAAPRAVVTFNASESSDPDGGPLTYSWDFGDSQGGSGNPVLHAYEGPGTYSIRLTVRDRQNLTASTMRTLVVTIPPRPLIAYDPATLFIGTVVTFDGGGSADPDGTIASWTWEFGDSNGDVGEEVTHAYDRRGAFTVTLTVRDDAGMTNTTSVLIQVRNRAPRLTSATPDNASVTMIAGTSRTFAVTASDPDGDTLRYTWRINGVVSGGDSPSLEFQESVPGTYDVSVTVSDGSDSFSREWTVTIPAPVGGLGWNDLLPTAALLAAIAAAAAFVAWRRQRKRRKELLGP